MRPGASLSFARHADILMHRDGFKTLRSYLEIVNSKAIVLLFLLGCCFVSALGAAGSIQGAELDSEVAQTTHRLGRVRYYQGDYTQAEKLFQDALRVVRGGAKLDAVFLSAILGDLALLYRFLGDTKQKPDRDDLYRRSEETYLEALELKRENLGVAHPGVSRTLMGLGLLYWQQGRYDKAEKQYEEALRVLDEAPSSQDSLLLDALRSLGLIRFRRGKSADAESFLQRALEASDKLKPASPPQVAMSLRVLADVYRMQGKHLQAEELYKRAEASFLNGPDDYELAATLMGLIELYQSQGRSREVEDLKRRVTAILSQGTPTRSSSLGILSLGLPISDDQEASMLNLVDWTLRSTYDSSLVPALPLRGIRTFDQLALLSPGVSRVPFTPDQGPAVGAGVGTAGQFSVNGFRGRSNNFTVDGSDNNDADIGVRRQGFVARVPQTVDSIQDFQIQTSGFQAEFGRVAGSIVNVVSRSGTTDWHGSAYGMFEGSALSAQNLFDQPFEDTTNATSGLSGGLFSGTDFGRSQAGGATGGEIIREKLFVFFSGEHQRRRGTSLGHFVVPAEDERGLRINPLMDSDGDGLVPIEQLGDFFLSRNIPYGHLAGLGVFSQYPLPNNPQGPFGQNTYSQVQPNPGDGIVLSGRADCYLSPQNTVTGRYNFTDDDSIIPFTSDGINSSVATDTRTQNISAYLNTATPRGANMVRVSYGRTRLRFPSSKGSPLLFGSEHLPSLPQAASRVIDTSFGSFGPFGATGPIGQLTIAPYSSIGVDVYNFPQGRVDNTYQVSDVFSWAGRSHGLKFGFDLRNYQLNSFSDRNGRPLLMFGHGIVSQSCTVNPRCLFGTEDGLLRGTDLAALGAAAGVLQTLSTNSVADSTIGLRLRELGFFVQDNWRIRNDLTLNLGLRYELNTVPSEVNQRIESTFGLSPSRFGHLNPDDFNDLQAKAVVTAGNNAFDSSLEALNLILAGRERIYSEDRNNFAPRIGLAWDPSGEGKAVIRAGYGIFYDANLGAITSQSRNVFPTFAPLNLDPNFSPPNGDFIKSPFFAVFTPTNQPLVRPGTLNSYNLSGDAFATGLGTLFNQAPPIPGASLSSNGLAFTLPEKELKTSYGQHFVFTVERQWHDYVASVGYVGTRGANLTRFVTPNGGFISTPVLIFPAPGSKPLLVLDVPPTVPPSELGRPQTNLGAYRIFQNSASSTYHSLQTSAQKRLSRGLQFRGSWVWSHAIDDVSDVFDGRGFFSLPQDSTALSHERASANFDSRHRLSFFLVWTLPTTSVGGIFKGWSLAAIGEFQTGQPYTVNSSIDRNLDGNLTDRPDSLEGFERCPDCMQQLRLGGDMSALELLAPIGQSGSVGRNAFRADGLTTIDLACTRRFRFKSDKALDFRVEIFNLLNHTSFGVPIRILESPGFGKSFDTQIDTRSLRLAVKLSF